MVRSTETEFGNAVKEPLNRLSERYRAALRKYLDARSAASSEPAVRLGRQAVALGLETLDLARIHQRALTTLVSQDGSSRSRAGQVKRATTFFNDAITPIERSHRGARKFETRLHELNQSLRQRAKESSAAAVRLKRGAAQCQKAEDALEKSKKHRATLLEKSRRLQRHLRHLTRKILSAQEDERHKTSHQLQDEIAQLLLGIHVRLLALRKAAKASTVSFKKEIASTQQLVAQSALVIQRFADGFGIHHET